MERIYYFGGKAKNLLADIESVTAAEEMTALEEQNYKWGADNLPE